MVQHPQVRCDRVQLVMTTTHTVMHFSLCCGLFGRCCGLLLARLRLPLHRLFRATETTAQRILVLTFAADHDKLWLLDCSSPAAAAAAVTLRHDRPCRWSVPRLPHRGHVRAIMEEHAPSEHDAHRFLACLRTKGGWRGRHAGSLAPPTHTGVSCGFASTTHALKPYLP